jgi:hypothetical protein
LPVISSVAHPERYLFYQNNFDEYKNLLVVYFNLTCWLLWVIMEIKSVRQQKNYLEGMYDYVGSVHHDNHINAFNQRCY